MIKWIIISLVASCSFISLAKAQSLQETFAAAELAFDQKDYSAAQTFFERAFYFSETAPSIERFLNLAKSQLETQNYGLAFNTLESASVDYRSQDSVLNEINLLRSKISLRIGNYQEMKYWLFQIVDTKSESQINAKYALLGLSHLLLAELDLADSAFRNTTFHSEFVKNQKDYSDILKKVKKSERKKPQLAMIMSMFLPGSGQLYAGFPAESANSLLLNATAAALYVIVLSNYGFIEAFILIYPWFLRYYNGGFKRAKKLVDLKKSRSKHEAALEIISLMKLDQKSEF